MSKHPDWTLRAVAVLAASCAVGSAHAAVTAAGTQANVGSGLFTPAVPKTLDPDGDNVYGTSGYVLFATADTPNSVAGAATLSTDAFTYENATRGERTITSMPSFITAFRPGDAVGNYGVSRNYGFATVDDPQNPGALREAGMMYKQFGASSTEHYLVNFTLGQGFPATGVRVGVLTDIDLGINNTPAYANVRANSGGATGNSGNVTLPAPDKTPDITFFDITGAPGETYTLYLGKRGTTSVIGVAGLTFDAIPAAVLAGDLNKDGGVDGLDINPFVYALLNGQSAFAAEYPTGSFDAGDMNGDTAVDGLDINPFVAALLGSGAEPAAVEAMLAAVPEPTSLGLLGLAATGALVRRRRG